MCKNSRADFELQFATLIKQTKRNPKSKIVWYSDEFGIQALGTQIPTKIYKNKLFHNLNMIFFF